MIYKIKNINLMMKKQNNYKEIQQLIMLKMQKCLIKKMKLTNKIEKKRVNKLLKNLNKILIKMILIMR